MHEGLALQGCFKIFFHGSQSERYTGNQPGALHEVWHVSAPSTIFFLKTLMF